MSKQASASKAAKASQTAPNSISDIVKLVTAAEKEDAGLGNIDSAKSQIEEKYQDLDRKYELLRFWAAFAVILAIDVSAFQHMSWFGTLVIFLLEAMFLLTLAYYSRVDGLYALLNALVMQCLEHLAKNQGNKG